MPGSYRLLSPRIRGIGLFVMAPFRGLVIVSVGGSELARLAGAAARASSVTQAVAASARRALREVAAEGIAARHAAGIAWLSRWAGHRLGFVRREACVGASEHTAAANGEARVLSDLAHLRHSNFERRAAGERALEAPEGDGCQAHLARRGDFA